MINKKLLFISILLLAVVIPAAAQNKDESIAKNKYNSGMAFYKEGKYEEALKDFNGLLEKYPASEWAAHALLQKGVYFMDVVGKADEAKAAFEKMAQDYPHHKKTPLALLKLGELQLNASDDIIKLNNPLATYERLIRTYPWNEYTAEAAYQAAGIYYRLGNIQKALEKIKMIDERFTKSSFYTASMLLKAEILVADTEYVEAAKLLQNSVDTAQGTPYGAKAKKMLTALQRIKIDPKYVYKTDSSFKLDPNQPLNSPRSIYLDTIGQIYVFDSDSKTVYVYDEKGAVVSTLSASIDPVVFTLGKDGRSIFSDAEGNLDADGVTAKLSYFDGQDNRDVSKPKLLFSNAFNNLFAVSRRGDHIFRYDSSFVFQNRVSKYEFESIRDAAADNYNKIFIIDDSFEGILYFNQTGSDPGKVAAVGDNYKMVEPVLIKFDQFNHMIVFDKKQESFFVFDSKKRLIKQISLPEQIEDVLDFAVSNSGELYILDEDLKTVVKVY